AAESGYEPQGPCPEISECSTTDTLGPGSSANSKLREHNAGTGCAALLGTAVALAKVCCRAAGSGMGGSGLARYRPCRLCCGIAASQASPEMPAASIASLCRSRSRRAGGGCVQNSVH
ncbi:unnamed protein product, partial [Polarella glacialis]